MCLVSVTLDLDVKLMRRHPTNSKVSVVVSFSDVNLISFLFPFPFLKKVELAKVFHLRVIKV